MSLGHQLREAIRSEGRSPHAIAEAAGVAPSILSRFLSGERPDLKLSTADALAGALGLRFSSTRRAPKPGLQASDEASAGLPTD